MGDSEQELRKVLLRGQVSDERYVLKLDNRSIEEAFDETAKVVVRIVAALAGMLPVAGFLGWIRLWAYYRALDVEWIVPLLPISRLLGAGALSVAVIAFYLFVLLSWFQRQSDESPHKPPWYMLILEYNPYVALISVTLITAFSSFFGMMYEDDDGVSGRADVMAVSLVAIAALCLGFIVIRLQKDKLSWRFSGYMMFFLVAGMSCLGTFFFGRGEAKRDRSPEISTLRRVELSSEEGKHWRLLAANYQNLFVARWEGGKRPVEVRMASLRDAEILPAKPEEGELDETSGDDSTIKPTTTSTRTYETAGRAKSCVSWCLKRSVGTQPTYGSQPRHR